MSRWRLRPDVPVWLTVIWRRFYWSPNIPLFHNVARPSFRCRCPNHWYRRRKQRYKTFQGTCSSLSFLPPDLYQTSIMIYLPTSNFMTLLRVITSYLRRRDSSSYLKVDHILSSISENSHMKRAIPTHPSRAFLISSQQFLLSTASQSTVRTWNGMHWTLPWHQRFFTLSVFPPLITSTSQISQISQCLVSLHLSKSFGSIWYMTSLDFPEEDNYFKTVQWEMLPKIREFHTSNSYRLPVTTGWWVGSHMNFL